MRLDLEDDERSDLLRQLPPALAWLEGALRQRGNRVLVHCHAGALGWGVAGARGGGERAAGGRPSWRGAVQRARKRAHTLSLARTCDAHKR
jgi:hypothetical protein